MTATQPNPVQTALSYSREDWVSGYRSQPNEYSYWISDVEGQIPADLEGTLFRNGPGLLEVGGQSVKHPFDGDGMISSIAIQDGRAYFRNRFVRTAGYVAEQQAQKPLYRGVFGTQSPVAPWPMPLISNSKILPTPTSSTGPIASWPSGRPPNPTASTPAP